MASDTLKNFYEGWMNYVFPNKDADELSKKRFAICKKCEHLTKMGRCRKCGCFMEAKSRAKKTKCPINLW